MLGWLLKFRMSTTLINLISFYYLTTFAKK
jgi:hypothetical protein